MNSLMPPAINNRCYQASPAVINGEDDSGGFRQCKTDRSYRIEGIGISRLQGKFRGNFQNRNVLANISTCQKPAIIRIGSFAYSQLLEGEAILGEDSIRIDTGVGVIRIVTGRGDGRDTLSKIS